MGDSWRLASTGIDPEGNGGLPGRSGHGRRLAAGLHGALGEWMGQQRTDHGVMEPLVRSERHTSKEHEAARSRPKGPWDRCRAYEAFARVLRGDAGDTW